jgi:hypothetical protein
VEPGVKVELSEVAIHAEGISDKLDAPIHLTVKSRVQENGALDAVGTVVPSPLAADVKFDLRNLDLGSLRSYLQTSSALKLASGFADLQEGLLSRDRRRRQV